MVVGYFLMAAGAALLIATRWRLTQTAGVAFCYAAGVLLVDRMPGGVVRNLVDVAQDALGGWSAVPTILGVCTVIAVLWGMISGRITVITGALALAIPTLMPFLAHGPLHDLWAWWTGWTSDIVDEIRALLGQSIRNAKPPTP